MGRTLQKFTKQYGEPMSKRNLRKRDTMIQETIEERHTMRQFADEAVGEEAPGAP